MKITTHILNTSLGKAAPNVVVSLHKLINSEWALEAQSITDDNGRIANFPNGLSLGTYKLYFDTNNYFTEQEVTSFYPYIEIVFNVTEDQHYHVPLLLNPYGYSTYRGT
jgi:5-hydroxyisourate hydrolase